MGFFCTKSFHFGNETISHTSFVPHGMLASVLMGPQVHIGQEAQHPTCSPAVCHSSSHHAQPQEQRHLHQQLKIKEINGDLCNQTNGRRGGGWPQSQTNNHLTPPTSSVWVWILVGGKFQSHSLPWFTMKSSSYLIWKTLSSRTLRQKHSISLDVLKEFLGKTSLLPSF